MTILKGTKKKMEFSKKLAIFVLVTYFIIIIGILAMSCLLGLGEGIAIGIAGLLTPIPVAIIGFYYNKAKAENLIKISNSTDCSSDESSDESIQ